MMTQHQPLSAAVALSLVFAFVDSAVSQERTDHATSVEQSIWPDYRGPHHDGHGPDRPLATAWSERDNVRWKTAIEGRGWSSPVVADGTIWLTTSDPKGHRLSMLAVALDSGEVVLREQLFEVAEPQFCHAFNSYASPSPVIAGDHVYISFGSPGTACVDRHSKKVLWKREDLSCDHFRGAGSSPFVHEDLVILTMDGADVQYLIALDRTSGETRWRTDRSTNFDDLDPKTGLPAGDGDLRKSYATPILIEVDGTAQLISPGAKAAFAYDPVTGKELWTVRYGEHSSAARTLFGHGLVYISTGYSRPHLLAVDPTGTGDITETHIRWRSIRGVPKKPSGVLVGEHLYLVNDGGIASCLAARTGESLWQERIDGAYSASLLHAGGHLYAFSEEGRTVVLKASEQFEVVAENTLDAGCLASPAVVDDSLIVRTRTHLYRIQ